MGSPAVNNLSLPEQLSRHVAQALRKTSLRLTDVDEMRAIIGRNAVPDYASSAEAFTYLYFGANFAKSYRAVTTILRERRFAEPLRILDLGCGAGASLGGAIAACKDADVPVERAVGLDQSPAQLRLFNDSVGLWLNREYPHIYTRQICADVWSIGQLPGEWDLIVASYLLCELNDSAFGQFLVTQAVRSDAEVLTIDSDAHGSPIWSSTTVGERRFDRTQLSIDVANIASLGLGEPKYSRRAA